MDYEKEFQGARLKNNPQAVRQVLKKWMMNAHEDTLLVLEKACSVGLVDVFDEAFQKFTQQHPKSNGRDFHYAMVLATSAGCAGIIETLLTCEPHNAYAAFETAAQCNHVHLLEVLHPYCDDKDRIRALNTAAKHGSLESLAHLMQLSDASDMNLPLENAILNNHFSAAQMLASLCSLDDNRAIEYACAKDDLPSLHMLLQHASPQKQCSQGLAWACFNNNAEMIDVLYPLSDTSITYSHIPSFTYQDGEEKTKNVLQEKIAQEQQKAIMQQMPISKTSKVVKKNMNIQEAVEFRRIMHAIMDPTQQCINSFSTVLSVEGREFLYTIASQHEKLYMMDELFDHGISEGNLERALLLAANNNSVTSIEKITPLITKLSSQPMMCALVMKHWACVEALYNITDINTVVKKLSHPDHHKDLVQFKAFVERKEINKSMPMCNKSSHVKKI